MGVRSIVKSWPKPGSWVDIVTESLLKGLPERQRVASETAEMIRMQIETLPGERPVIIQTLTLNVTVNYCSGAEATQTIEVKD